MSLLESKHGFLFAHNSTKDVTRVDLYVPWDMLTKLQLRSGSIMMVQGLDEDPLKEIHLKPAKARLFEDRQPKGTSGELERGEKAQARGIPFVATIRFPDKPHTLNKFLEAAAESEVSFVSIRTSGARRHALSDVMCEGTIEQDLEKIGDFSESGAIDQFLQKLASAAGGIVIDSHKIVTSTDAQQWAQVLSSRYRVELPLLRGSYGKVRLDLRPSPAIATATRTPQLVTVLLNPRMMTLTADLDYANEHAYLVSFNAPELVPDAPVTHTLLRTLSDQDNALNVAALDAFEYRKWDPSYAKTIGAPTIRSTGVIEALLTKRGEPLEPKETETAVKERIRDFWKQEEPSVHVQYVVSALEEMQRRQLRGKGPPEDVAFIGFDKRLNQGRYVFLGPIGSGGFGVVNKYLDLTSREEVAIKHINEPERFNRAEVNAFSAKSDERGPNPHLAKVIDHFEDGSSPVIVMEFVPYVLENHVFNPGAELASQRHKRPGSIVEYLGMAEQLLSGLAWLHEGGAGGERVVHADIKPGNLGFALPDGGILWKHLDLGLARELPVGENLHQEFVAAGTLPFMSPQALQGRPFANNDIYSLGIVLFMLWNEWAHPSGESEEILKQQPSAVVRTYVDTAESGSAAELGFQEFDPGEWTVMNPFGETVPHDALVALRKVVYTMLRVSQDDRYQTARDAIDEFRRIRLMLG